MVNFDPEGFIIEGSNELTNKNFDVITNIQISYELLRSMICKQCGLEMTPFSQIAMTIQGESKPNRTPMAYKCPNGHTQYRDYDNLKTI
jgi:hypothetical protein